MFTTKAVELDTLGAGQRLPRSSWGPLVFSSSHISLKVTFFKLNVPDLSGPTSKLYQTHSTLNTPESSGKTIPTDVCTCTGWAKRDLSCGSTPLTPCRSHTADSWYSWDVHPPKTENPTFDPSSYPTLGILGNIMPEKVSNRMSVGGYHSKKVIITFFWKHTHIDKLHKPGGVIRKSGVTVRTHIKTWKSLDETATRRDAVKLLQSPAIGHIWEIQDYDLHTWGRNDSLLFCCFFLHGTYAINMGIDISPHMDGHQTVRWVEMVELFVLWRDPLVGKFWV